MGDPKRFDLFSKVIAKHLSPDMRIADVAGGKGILQSALRQLNFSKIQTWDKRSNRKNGDYRYDYFSYLTAPDYDAVVAMHPDEGTDHCIMYAATRRVKAIICPCCVKPSAITYWGKQTYKNWVKHLMNLAITHKMSVMFEKLPMNGKNDVMIILP